MTVPQNSLVSSLTRTSCGVHKVSASWDDGCASDLRVADLMEKYEIPTTFYWPVEWHSLAHENGYIPLWPDECLDILRRHELGSHTITHRHLTKISPDEAEYEIQASQALLMVLFGVKPKKFAPPRGYTNRELTKFTLKLYDSQRLTKWPGLVHVHPNSGANDNRPWRQKLDEELKKGDVELWGHSQELDKYELWLELEDALCDLRRQ